MIKNYVIWFRICCANIFETRHFTNCIGLFYKTGKVESLQSFYCKVFIFPSWHNLVNSKRMTETEVSAKFFQKMLFFKQFKDHNSGRKHGNQTNGPISSSTFFALTVCTFISEFYLNFYLKFVFIWSPLWSFRHLEVTLL